MKLYAIPFTLIQVCLTDPAMEHSTMGSSCIEELKSCMTAACSTVWSCRTSTFLFNTVVSTYIMKLFVKALFSTNTHLSTSAFPRHHLTHAIDGRPPWQGGSGHTSHWLSLHCTNHKYYATSKGYYTAHGNYTFVTKIYWRKPSTSMATHDTKP